MYQIVYKTIIIIAVPSCRIISLLRELLYFFMYLVTFQGILYANLATGTKFKHLVLRIKTIAPNILILIIYLTKHTQWMYDSSISLGEANLAQNAAKELKVCKKLAPIKIILITIHIHHSLHRTLSLLTYTHKFQQFPSNLFLLLREIYNSYTTQNMMHFEISQQMWSILRNHKKKVFEETHTYLQCREYIIYTFKLKIWKVLNVTE